MANPVLFLASKEASYFTRTDIVVDGGLPKALVAPKGVKP